MVRHPVAVQLACLFAVGGLPAVAAAVADATLGSGTASVPRVTHLSRQAAATVSPPAGRPVAARHGCRTAGGGPARVLEPRQPGPDEIARMASDLRRRWRERYGSRPMTGALERPGANRGAKRVGPVRTPKPVERITIPLWVHIIKDGALGLPDSAVARQVDTLNAAYSGRYGGADTGVRFRLRGITHTVNRAWFRAPLAHEIALKEHLHVGGPETLNLYVAQLGALVLGYATYPHWYADQPTLDGVVIDWRSVPGGPLRNFARGFTAVHEIGHWLGLLHTFENGCAPPGDGVDDTPAEARPTTGCPARKDTCPAPGQDPVRNFMNYTRDRCMREFTAGQGARVRRMWDLYRRPVGRPLL